MKKFTFFLLILCLVLSKLLAKEVDPATAKRVAENFYKYSTNRNSVNLSLNHTEKNEENKPLFYVFSEQNNAGFVIVAGDDAAEPVLAYSYETNFNFATANPSVKYWLEGYKEEIRNAILLQFNPSKETQQKWDNYINNYFETGKTRGGVQPLCKAKWSQSPHENALCPPDPMSDSPNKRCVTGCPATAMAIIMKYHNHPSQGTGSSSYNHPKYGTLSVNYGNESYNFAEMTDTIKGPNNEIARLMYHSGVSCKMNYAPNESGSLVIKSYCNGDTTATCEYAYTNFFGYDKNTVRGVQKKDFTDANWKDLIKTELNNNRPIQYSGFGGGGHTFVCDGYDDNDKYHMNWGWGGMSDGFYALNALNPGAGGTGSGEGHYNNDQQACIGIKPAVKLLSSAPVFGLKLNSNITLSVPKITKNTPFNVTVNIGYAGSTAYTTNLSARIFTTDGELVDVIELKNNETFNDGANKSYTFSTNGIDIIQGKYTIGIYSNNSNDNNWTLIRKAGFINPLEVIVDGVPTNLVLNAAIKLPSTTIYEKANYTISVDLKNQTTKDFDGYVSADIFDKDGDYLDSITTPLKVSIKAGQTLSGVNFTKTNSTLSPGTYLVAIFESLDNNEYEILEGFTYENPIEMNILATPLLPDVYENNDNASNSYKLPVNFVGNTANVLTTGSNIHIPSDFDFYSLNLPSGYNYTITGRLHDAQGSGNSLTYSGNVTLAYILGALLTEMNKSITSPIDIKNGGNIVFKITPSYIGLTGSYLMDLTITREINTATNDLNNYSDLEISPNPANQFVTLSLKNNTIREAKITITNSVGQKVKSIENANFSTGKYALGLNDLVNGQYIVKITQGTTSFLQKLNISK